MQKRFMMIGMGLENDERDYAADSRPERPGSLSVHHPIFLIVLNLCSTVRFEIPLDWRF